MSVSHSVINIRIFHKNVTFWYFFVFYSISSQLVRLTPYSSPRFSRPSRRRSERIVPRLTTACHCTSMTVKSRGLIWAKDPWFLCVCVVLWLFLMLHEKHNKRQKRLKVMEDTAKEGGVTLTELTPNTSAY